MRRRPAAPTRSPTEWLEWALGAVAGAAVLAIVGFLVLQGVSATGDLPELVVAPAAPGDATAQPQLRFTLTNRGGRAARSVVVSLTLEDGAGVAEVRRITVDEVPAGAIATGAFLLPPDAARLTPSLAVEGYLDP